MFVKPEIKVFKIDEVPPPNPEPYIQGITRDGIIAMKFSEEMIVPNFVGKRRMLEATGEKIELSKIDATGIVDIKFGQKPSEDTKSSTQF